ncbi:hypothetical protein [Chitinimonas arctica]|nr:hypothetical protein [Chitinimonas arctica]
MDLVIPTQSTYAERSAARASAAAASPESITELCDFIRHDDPRHTEVDLSGRRLTRYELTQLSQALRGNTQVRKINLRNNGIDAAGAAILAKGLGARLVELDLGGNHLRDKGASYLAMLLRSTPTLASLDISRNGIGTRGAMLIADELPLLSSLRKLDMSGNEIHCGGICVLEARLEHSPLLAVYLAANPGWSPLDRKGILRQPRLARVFNAKIPEIHARIAANDPQCTELDLSGRRLAGGDVFIIFCMLENNQHILKINLRSNDIGHCLPGLIGQGGCCRLIELDLSGNGIFYSSINAIADFLAQSATIRKMDLSGNYILDTDMPLLVEGLRRNTSLTHLDLSANLFKMPGVRVLTANWSEAGNIRRLDLRDNSLESDAAKLLARWLSSNATLTGLELDLSGNISMGNSAAFELGKTLPSIKGLRCLALQGCGISDPGAEVLAQGLGRNQTVVAVDLRGNYIGPAAVGPIKEALRDNRSLTDFDLSDNLLPSRSVWELGHRLAVPESSWTDRLKLILQRFSVF